MAKDNWGRRIEGHLSVRNGARRSDHRRDDVLLQGYNPTVEWLLCDEEAELDGEEEIICTKKPNLIGIFSEKIDSTVQTIAKNGPNLILDVAKIAVDNILKGLSKVIESMKSSKLGLTEGQQFLVQQLLSQVLDPFIEMLTAFKPYLDDAKTKEAQFELVPDEVILVSMVQVGRVASSGV